MKRLTRFDLDALPCYSAIVALDDDTDIRVKTGDGSWSVSRRYTGERGDTHLWTRLGGFRILHVPQ